MLPSRPSQQLDELKGPLYGLILLVPLLAALFAEKIDNEFVSCALFVGLLGIAYSWLRKRLVILEASIREQEEHIEKLEAEPAPQTQPLQMRFTIRAEDDDRGDPPY